MRNPAVIGMSIGLTISIVIIALMVAGVSGVLIIRGVDLMYLLWPSAMMLIVGWNNTLLGLTITLVSVLINGLTYMIFAVVLRTACVFCFTFARNALLARPKPLR